MAKNKNIWVCNNCEAEFERKMFGGCPNCKKYEGFTEKDTNISTGLKNEGPVKPVSKAKSLKEINLKAINRTSTGINEMDRVLGGGFVESEVVLFAGFPGAGKALRGNTLIPLAKGGFKPLDHIVKGDTLIDKDGNPTKVLNKFFPEINTAYKIIFDDGVQVDACADHLWLMANAEILTTEQLFRKQYGIIDMVKVNSYKKTPAETLSNGPLHAFREEYLFSKNIYRESLLARITFDSKQSRKHLSVGKQDVKHAISLANSLGIKVNPKTLSYNPQTSHVRYVEKVIPTSVDETFQCIMVDSPSSTFLCTENYLVTHNSTLSLDVANKIAQKGTTVLYSSGEESEGQIGLRAQRMNITNDKIKIINETSIEKLLGYIEAERPGFVIVDSLQTLASENISGSIGSTSQSKEAANSLTQIAKKNNITMILINQMIKSGDFSGSESIQHIVDATLMLDSDKESPLKFLRATKNRFGDTTEVGVFQHTADGLEEVSDPSGILFDNNDLEELSGTSFSFISEGVRQIPIEVQSLVTMSSLTNPRRQFNGVSFNRGQIVCAILDKFCKMKLNDYDVFVNTVSGVKVNDPLSDLSVAAAIYSSKTEEINKNNTVFIGELSLTGQVRGSFMIENKIKEAARLGFDEIVIPVTASKNIQSKYNIKISTIKNIVEIKKFFKQKS